MDCSGCGKEDIQDYNQHLIDNTWYYLCEGDNSCENRVKQAILRTVLILREQHGLTLFDHGVPMNPQIGGMALPEPEWIARDIPQPEAFFNQVDGFLCNMLDWLAPKLESCVDFIPKFLYKLRNLSHFLREKYGRQ